MLPKNNRLTTQEFSQVYQKGVAVCGTFVCVHAAQIAQQSETLAQISKFACTVGKKQLKGAVGRNRVRRRLYGAVDNLRKLHNYPPHNFIIRAKLPLGAVTPEQLENDITVTITRTLKRLR